MPRIKPLPKYLAGLVLVGVIGYFGWKAMDEVPSGAYTADLQVKTPAKPTPEPVVQSVEAPAPGIAPPQPIIIDPGLAKALEAGRK